MKLIYPLPENEKILLDSLTDDERVLYCVPANLDESGTYVEGWAVVTERRFIHIRDGAVRIDHEIGEKVDYVAGGRVPEHHVHVGLVSPQDATGQSPNQIGVFFGPQV